MKVTITRQLRGGQYSVGFRVSVFTTEELSKMQSFGVPNIQLSFIAAGTSLTQPVPINQINENFRAVFHDEAEARKYEQRVLNDIRAVMAGLRTGKDSFSSTEEVSV